MIYLIFLLALSAICVTGRIICGFWSEASAVVLVVVLLLVALIC